MNTHPIKPQTQPSIMDTLRRSALPTQHQKLVHQTQRLVAQTFYGPMLKQMRDSPFKSKMFSGGRGGQAFTEMLDQHLAERMSRGVGGNVDDTIAARKHTNLVNSIVKHIEHPHQTDFGSTATTRPSATTLPTTPSVKRSVGVRFPALSKVSPHVPVGR